jgi:hypothetical protein
MVPIEMYQNIFQFVGKQDLIAFSRVSHTFQHEAEHLLYNYVDLAFGHNQTFVHHRGRVITWCIAVTRVERRARRVHTLRLPPRIPLPSTSFFAPKMDVDINLIVAQAFHAVVNLKHLFFVGSQRELASLPVYPSTLRDCTFSLSSFVGQVSSFSTENQIEFLLRHPEIEYWVPTDPFLHSVTSFPSNMLPRLRELVLSRPALTHTLRGRPVEALVLQFSDERHTRTLGLQAITPMGFLGDTLHTLVYIHGRIDADWSTVDILDALAQETPNLRSLAFTHSRVGEFDAGVSPSLVPSH